MRFLFPKEPAFFEYFQKLLLNLKELALLYGEFALKFNNFEHYSKKAKEIEKKADELTHLINNKLNESFITPFDREDIHLLANKMDDILDLIENVIHNIEIYEIRYKNPILEDFAKIIIQGSEELEKLIFKCFLGKKSEHKKEDLIVKIHDLEDLGDVLFQKGIKELFLRENDPIKIIKWKDILESLEKIMDTFQKVSDVAEGILIKSS